MDFQVREPVSPLLTGLLPNTNVMMEVQAAQEYTGQAGESPQPAEIDTALSNSFEETERKRPPKSWIVLVALHAFRED